MDFKPVKKEEFHRHSGSDFDYLKLRTDMEVNIFLFVFMKKYAIRIYSCEWQFLDIVVIDKIAGETQMNICIYFILSCTLVRQCPELLVRQCPELLGAARTLLVPGCFAELQVTIGQISYPSNNSIQKLGCVLLLVLCKSVSSNCLTMLLYFLSWALLTLSSLLRI